MKKKNFTKEEKVATTMVGLVNDFTLDLDLVGVYVAETASTVLYNRLITVADSAEQEREKQNDTNR